MDLGYPFQGWPDSYVDELGENGGTMYLRCQSGTGLLRIGLRNSDSW